MIRTKPTRDARTVMRAQILSWTRKVERALAKGEIQSFELDRRLLSDIEHTTALGREPKSRQPKS